MQPITLKGETLGEKHKHFHKLVRDAVDNKEATLSTINYDDRDMDNLLKIHTACKTKNVDYIIEVLKCEDMLYVSTAIRHSTWLITEKEYTNIVNPEYLYKELFPHMLTQAINKLLLYIRLHLKDEKRVEAFYDYFIGISKKAHKWLLHCSIPFIENVLQKGRCIPLQIFKRLCKRSVIFLQYYSKLQGPKDCRAIKEVEFLVKSHTEEYLNIIDTQLGWRSKLTRKSSAVIMKKYPQRILDNFVRYSGILHLPTIAKYLKNEEIKDFLLKHVHLFRRYDVAKYFIEKMPINDRSKFIKEVYLPQGLTSPSADECSISCFSHAYQWYRYMPFDEAFTALKEIIRTENSVAERHSVISVLVTCAKNNPSFVKTLLLYYYEEHTHEIVTYKISFLNELMSQIATHELDTESWNILDKLFCSLDVYTKPEYKVQMCLRAIVIYKFLHHEEIPYVVKENLYFETFKKCRFLNEEQNNTIFTHLLNLLSSKLRSKDIINENDFCDVVNLLKKTLLLLMNWNKNITEYDFLLHQIKKLTNIKKLNSWKCKELSSIYHIKKSWRKYMFQQSIPLSPSEEVCLNALKHEPQLLDRYSEEMDALRANDSYQLRRFLTKLRVYWPDSIGLQWTDAYFKKVNQITPHKALVKRLLTLLTQKQLIDLAVKYAPENSEIDQRKNNEIVFELRKNIASCLHVARPLPSLDLVLLYTKFEYLPDAESSLNGITQNLSSVQSRYLISILLEGSVFLQNHGIQLAFTKLNSKEIKPIFSDLWNATMYSTIRTRIFKYTHHLLCKEKDPLEAKVLWDLFSTFIDCLTSDEKPIIFIKLCKIKHVHESVRGEFYMKSYNFLTSLPVETRVTRHIDSLISYAPYAMELLDANFVVDHILMPIEDKVLTAECPLIHVMSSYLLFGKTEEEQSERFRRILAPALKHALFKKCNVDIMINAVIVDCFKLILAKKIIIPVKLFSEIECFLSTKMCLQTYYVQYTRWRLASAYIKLIFAHKTILNNPLLDHLSLPQFKFVSMHGMPPDAQKIQKKLHRMLSPKMGQIILTYLKYDTEKHSPSIYLLFCEALEGMFECLGFYDNAMEIEVLKNILDEDFIPSYLLVCQYRSATYTIGVTSIFDKTKGEEIVTLLELHPSKEVRMHFTSLRDSRNK